MLGILTNAISLLLLVTHLLPGLVFGLLLAYSITSKFPYWKVITLTILCTTIYITVLFLVKIPDSENRIVAGRIFIASGVGALLTSLVYQMLIFQKIIRKKSLLWAFIFGCVASIPCTISFYLLDKIAYDDKVLENLSSVGIFSIYPLWYSLVTLHLSREEASYKSS